MQVIWAIGSRSGSEFVMHMTATLLPGIRRQLLYITTSRGTFGDYAAEFKAAVAAGNVLSFISQGEFDSIKIEDPGIDGMAKQICDAYPETKVIASFRPFLKVAASHSNIRPWGMTPEEVLRAYRSSLEFYRGLMPMGRLLLIDIEDKANFNARRFCQFLGVRPTAEFKEFIANWPVVNDLVYQKSFSKDETPVVDPGWIVDRYGGRADIAELESGYRELVSLSNRRTVATGGPTNLLQRAGHWLWQSRYFGRA